MTILSYHFLFALSTAEPKAIFQETNFVGIKEINTLDGLWLSKHSFYRNEQFFYLYIIAI
jgi:hypothetical protein